MNTRSNDLQERLRSLPMLDPPSSGWADLHRMLEESRRQKRQRTALLALAASVVLTVGTLSVVPILRTPASTDGGTGPSQEVATLMAQSRALESNLRRSREHVAVWDARSAARAAALQSELSIVDLQLSYAAPASAQRLWRDRIDLLSNLLQTHQEAGLMNASFVSRAENEL